MEPSESPSPSRSQLHADDDTTRPRSQSKHVQFTRDAGASLGHDETLRTPFAKSNGRSRRSVEIAKEDDNFDEQSPLLPPRQSEEVGKIPSLSPLTSPDASSGEWDVHAGTKEDTKSSWYLFLLTISFGGLQIAWSVELSNGSPYLLGLGVTKSLLALVWIAGPLSGTLVQPYVGIKSDRSRSRFGKRRPFMVGGAIATITSLLILAWAREITGGFLAIFGVARDSEGTRSATIVVAVLMIYVLDFSINVIQAGIRAFVVDNAPTHQQDSANAWASRVLGLGNIIGYLFGYADLPKYLWFFGNTQFKVLSVIAALAMATTLAISCLSVSERDPRLEGEPSKQEGGVVSFFVSLWKSMRRLPPQIKKVCVVQLAAWVGWFPFLFYITTYIGELYVDPIFRANPNMSDKEIDEAWEHGTRMGTFALLVYAVVTFLASVILPWFVASSYQPTQPPIRTPYDASPTASRTPGTPLTPMTNRVPSGEGYFGLQPASRNAGAVDVGDSLSIKSVAAPWLRGLRNGSLQIPWLTLKRAWMLSHVMFAVLMWLTFLAHSTKSAIFLVGLVGIPWAMTNWAPFALIAAEISKRDSIRRGLIPPPPTRDGELLSRGEDMSEGADQAGVVLGIHNVAIAAPQVVATLVSSVIFKFLQKPRGTAGDDSVAWVLRFGGILTLVAAWLTRRIAEEGDDEETPPKW